MKFKEPINKNYAGTIVRIESLIPIEGSDNIVHTNIFGNLVIIDKSIEVGKTGIFFPVECALDKEFLSVNNLYKDSTLNVDKEKKGFFEESGRIKALKLRGAISSGLFLPLTSLSYLGTPLEEYPLESTFDEVNGKSICKKFVTYQRTPGSHGPGKVKKSILVDWAFNLHYDTENLGKNMGLINPDSDIFISRKIHGTSHVSSLALCKKKLSFFQKILKAIGFKVEDTEYKNIWSSRSVIKSDNEDSSYNNTTDIWALANEKIKHALIDGMGIYAEIVGYEPSGKLIQKPYSYGCKKGDFKVVIYRITRTFKRGITYEFSPTEILAFCDRNDLISFHKLWSGKATSLVSCTEGFDVNVWRAKLLEKLRETFLEKDCGDFDKGDKGLPDEGIVVRIRGISKALKLKSFKFLSAETKALDKGEVSMEDQA